MGKQKKTRKFAEVKRLLNPKDAECAWAPSPWQPACSGREPVYGAGQAEGGSQLSCNSWAAGMLAGLVQGAALKTCSTPCCPCCPHCRPPAKKQKVVDKDKEVRHV